MEREPSYEELAAFSAGDLDEGLAREIREHARDCEACRRRLEALRETDERLRAALRAEPSAKAVLGARRAVSAEIRKPAAAPEIMTLEEVAEYLRIPVDELEGTGDLPAFEIAGNVRVRRERLLEWIAQREKSHARKKVESEVAASLRGGPRREVLRWLTQ